MRTALDGLESRNVNPLSELSRKCGPVIHEEIPTRLREYFAAHRAEALAELVGAPRNGGRV
jgi:hypothetical protein